MSVLETQPTESDKLRL